MKKILLIFFLISQIHFSQEFNYALITDLHIGASKSEDNLKNVVSSINSDSTIEFVIASGDITEKSTNLELGKVKQMLDLLKVPYFIIPGNHDTKWSESGGLKFKELWNDDKFIFEKNNLYFIGLNTGILFRGGGGHINTEDIVWLDSVLTYKVKQNELYLVVHHPLVDDVDNWFKLTNLLIGHNIKLILNGHGHQNKKFDYNGIHGVMGRAVYSNKEDWGYNLILNKKDSIIITSVDKGTLSKKPWVIIDKNNPVEITKIDSNQYSTKYFTSRIELNSKIISPLVSDSNRIIAATYDGIIHCIDNEGNIVWNYNTYSNIVSRPLIYKNFVIIGNLQGDLIKLDIEKGTPIASIGIDEPITSQIIYFYYTGDQQMMFENDKNIDAVLFGTSTGKTYCFSLNYFEPIWENESPKGMIETRPLFLDGRIYFGSWDGYFYCLNSNNGQLIWKWTNSGNFYYSPAACIPQTNGSEIFVTSPDKSVYSLDALLGKVIRKDNNYSAWESIGISNDSSKLFIKSLEDKLHIINSKSGKLIKEILLDNGVDTSPVEIIQIGDNIFVPTRSGFLLKIDGDYKTEKIAFAGTSRLNSITKLGNDRIAVSNSDGIILIINITKEKSIEKF